MVTMEKLILGDCLDVLKRGTSESISAIITDPPYGIDYQSARRTDKTKWKPKIANDKTPFTAWLPEAYRVLRVGGGMACFVRCSENQRRGTGAPQREARGTHVVLCGTSFFTWRHCAGPFHGGRPYRVRCQSSRPWLHWHRAGGGIRQDRRSPCC